MLASVCHLIWPKKLLGLIAVEGPVFRVSFFDDVDTKLHRKTAEKHTCKDILVVIFIQQFKQIVMCHFKQSLTNLQLILSWKQTKIGYL